MFALTSHNRRIARINKHLLVLIVGLQLFFSANGIDADPGKKILYINSYHAGYPWSDGITHGIESRLQVEDIWFKIFYMDTKRSRAPDEIAQTAQVAKALIEKMSPDVVIVSDDNAVKHILEPWYKNAELPFVYCGVNWESSVYGLPYKNATGMVEIDMVDSLVRLLESYASGQKLGFLSLDALSGHRVLESYQAVLGKNVDRSYFVNTVEEWESKFIKLQQEVDLILLENPEGIEGWNQERALPFVMSNVKVPVGSAHEWLAPFSLLSIAKIPEEQGWWAAEQAVKILNGDAAANIPEVRNRQGKLYANLAIAEKLGITLSAEVLQTATFVGQQ